MARVRAGRRLWSAAAGGAVVGLLASVLVAAGPAVAVSGQPTEVREVSANDTTRSKELTALCPAGRVPLSGGFGISRAGPEWDVGLTQFFPVKSDGRSGFAVSGVSGPSAPSWQLSVQALCRPEPAGYEQVSEVLVVPEREPIVTLVRCPGTTLVVGVGGLVWTGFGEPDAYLAEISYRNLRTVEVRGTRRPGFTGGVAVVAFAICAEVPAFSSVLVEVSTDRNNHNPKLLSDACPRSYRPWGVGAVTDPFRGMKLLALQTHRHPPNRSGRAMVHRTAPRPDPLQWRLKMQLHCVFADP